MAKYRGMIGFGLSEEASPGVWKDVITEYPFSGDVLQAARQTEGGEKVNPDQVFDNTISIVGNAFAFAHILAIRYIEWAGERWKISHIDLKRPRLIFRMGGVYDGPTPAPAPPDPEGA